MKARVKRPEGAARSANFVPRTETVHQGKTDGCPVGTLGLFVADRTSVGFANTNNGLGEAWLSNVNHGGTP
jgi:hypothetical protein